MPKIYEYRGVEGLVYAEVTKDNNNTGTGEGYVTGTVKPLAGVAEISKSSDSASEAHFYDNIPAVVITSTGADTVTISASAIPLDVLADITGQTYDSTTGTYIEEERQQKYFAIGYQTKNTDGETVYVWRLKGTFNIPDQTNATENEGTDANGQELVYTGISTTHKFTKTTKPAKAVNVNTALDLVAAIDDFFDSVQTPDTITAKA
jgi:phi13 family phage major tail protein